MRLRRQDISYACVLNKQILFSQFCSTFVNSKSSSLHTPVMIVHRILLLLVFILPVLASVAAGPFEALYCQFLPPLFLCAMRKGRAANGKERKQEK